MTDTNWPPLILAVAPNGARKTKSDHPALPLTPGELAATAAACQAAGAALLHLHVRDAQGRHSLDAGLYREAIAEIRATVGEKMILQVTSEAVGRYDAEEQMAMVRTVEPEAVSLGLREIIPDAEAEDAAARFLAWLTEADILPQYILYDAEVVRRFDALAAKGVIPRKARSVLYVLGRYSAGQQSEPKDLLAFLAAHGGDEPWALCAFGAKETACAVAAAALGGHARIGFENNMLLPDGSRAQDNAALVTATAAAVDAIGRPLADAAEARAILRA